MAARIVGAEESAVAEQKRAHITRVYTRVYRDNGSTKAYVEWSNGARTEGEAEDYHGVLVPIGTHMGALFDCALRAGLTVEREVW